MNRRLLEFKSCFFKTLILLFVFSSVIVLDSCKASKCNKDKNDNGKIEPVSPTPKETPVMYGTPSASFKSIN